MTNIRAAGIQGGDARREALAFIEFLTGSEATPVCTRLLDDNKTRKLPASKLFGPIADLWPQIEAKQREGFGAFVVVNGGGDRDDEIKDIRSLFIDLDGKPRPEDWEWHEPPDAIVSRDETHHHVYWLTDTDVTPTTFNQAQRQLAERYGGDRSVCNPSRVMRLPGTQHLKDPAEPSMYRRDAQTGVWTGERRSLAKLTTGLSAAPPQAVAKRRTAAVAELDLPYNVRRAERYLAIRTPAVGRVGNSEGENGNDHTYQTAAALRDLGVSEETALDLMLENWNDRCLPLWDADELQQVIVHAWEYGQNEPGAWALTTDPSGRFAHYITAGREQASAAKRPARFVLRSETMQDARPPITWMVDGLLQDPCTIVMFALWNSYKSFAALDIALAVASGKPAFGRFKINRTGPVIYMAGEGAGGIETQRRPAWRTVRGIEPSRVLPFYTVECVPVVKSEIDTNACKTTIREAIAAKMIERPALIVIDTLARAMVGLNANDEGDAGLFLALAEDLKAEFGCTVLTVAHEGKERERGIRGSSALPAGFDILLKMEADTDALTATIECPKIKDGSPIEKFGLRGRQIPLSNGQRSLVFDWADPRDFRGAKLKTLTSQDVGTALKSLGAERGVTVTTDNLAAVLAGEFGADEKVVRAKARTLQRGQSGRFAAYVAYEGKGRGDSTLWTLPAREA